MISVIVPAFDAEATIGACLDALAAQRGLDGPWEVIVVDDGSTDRTAEIVRRHPLAARLIGQPHCGAAAARNRGAAAAAGDILLFTDADCRPWPDWAAGMARPLADARVAGVKGRFRSDQTALVARLAQAEYEEKEAHMLRRARVTFADTAAAGYRADVFRAAGGFRADLQAVEDTELAFRLAAGGHVLVMAPDAFVDHRHPETLAAYLRRKLRYGVWGAQAYAAHPGRMVEDSRTPWTMRLQLALAPLAAGTTLWAIVARVGPLAIAGPSASAAAVINAALIATTLPFAWRARASGWDAALAAPWLCLARAAALDLGLAAGLARRGVLPSPPGPLSPFILGRLALAALAHGLLWMAIVPPWQTPDEPKHFEYVRLLAEHGQVVAFQTEAEAADPELQAAIVASMDAHRFWWYGHAPGYDPARPSDRFADLWLKGSHTAFYRSSPAYYWLVSRVQPADRLTGLYVARLWSVLFGAAMVLFAGWAARELFPDDPLVRYGTPAFVALHPMAAFLASGVNNDVLVNALAMLAFVWMARLVARGGSVARLLVLGGTVAAAVAVKRTAVFLAPVALVAILAWLALRARRHPMRAGAAVGALAVAVLAGGLWWAAGGASAVPEASRNLVHRYLFNEPDQLDRLVAILQAPGIGPILLEYAWGLHNGFWGSFGWQLVNFPAPVYVVLAGVTLVAAAGLARRWRDPATPGAGRAGIVVAAASVLLAAAGATLFFMAYLDQPYAPPPQGRYLFAALGPIAILLTAGLGAWVPPAQRPRALAAFVAAMAAFDALALFGFVAPYFYR